MVLNATFTNITVISWQTSSFGPTIKHVPSRLEKALTACSGIIYVTKANPFNFLVKESMGRCVSVNGPIIKKN
jgi:hypothetical protein